MARAQQAAGWAGGLPVGVMLSMIALEYSGARVFVILSIAFSLATVAIFAFSVKASRVVFVIIAIVLVIWAAQVRADWAAGVSTAILRGALVVALLSALVAIRSAAMSSAEILECGRFLARQRPGLRYSALTIGGHLFGLILLYGSISLLGSLAMESTAREPDPELRSNRIRRMMVAIQRGFASTLCWSPLGFSMAITLAIVPGASWSGVVLPGLVSALMMLAGGWVLDTLFKPKLSKPPPPRAAETAPWAAHLRPLLTLLGVVMSSVALLHVATGVSVIGAVMTAVPLIAILWIAFQSRPQGIGRSAWTGSRIKQFITSELPVYRGEIVLLFMAGFIGSMGSFMLVPLLQARGLDLAIIPPLAIVIAMIWIIPLTGQIGMNPILAVSLLIPLLPTPAAMGIHPAAFVTAITAGWALSGTTSPFTASVLLSAAMAGVSPNRAGIGWNGIYTLVMGSVLSAWVLLLALIL